MKQWDKDYNKEINNLLKKSIRDAETKSGVNAPDEEQYMTKLNDAMTSLLYEKDTVDSSQDSKPIDISALRVKPNTIWELHLAPSGKFDPVETCLVDDHATAAEKARAVDFFLIRLTDNSGEGSVRALGKSYGMPSAASVVRTLQQGMAQPFPPSKPYIPAWLRLNHELIPMLRDLQPFIASLSKTQCFVETEQEYNQRLLEERKVWTEFLRNSTEKATAEKVAGNTAYKRENRKGAVKAYTDAIGTMRDALVKAKVSDEEKRNGERLVAICFANRAVVYLLEGAGIDAQKAANDAKMAQEWDPEGNYTREVQALRVLKQNTAAMDTLCRALRRPSLSNESSLVDPLIDLQTLGKGLPSTEAGMKAWLAEVMKSDECLVKRMDGVEGEWKRRVEEQLRSVKGK